MSSRELRASRRVGPARRTYGCLEGQTHKPSDYEIVTTQLLYYPSRGFEVHTPVWQHYQAKQQRGVLRCSRWDSFEDPSHTTYSSYVAARRDQETFLDRLFEAPPQPLDLKLRPLAFGLSALRFPLHGLQMVSAYVGALAPSGRIAVAAAFQAADELRRVQRLCQWLGRSGIPIAELDAGGRELWQAKAEFQPLRRLIEQLLVSYDWGETLIALNRVIKPALEPLLAEHVPALARRHGAELLAQVLESCAVDAVWHAGWFDSLRQLLVDDDPENAAVISRCVQALRLDALAAAQGARGALLGPL